MEPVPPQDHVIRFDDVTVSFPTEEGKPRVVLTTSTCTSGAASS